MSRTVRPCAFLMTTRLTVPRRMISFSFALRLAPLTLNSSVRGPVVDMVPERKGHESGWRTASGGATRSAPKLEGASDPRPVSPSAART